MAYPRPLLQRYLFSDLPPAEALLPQLRRLDETRWYSNFGVLNTEFEQQLQQLLTKGDPHPEYGRIELTTMVTGYHAIEVGLRMLALPPGSAVLVPAVTFPACPIAVQNAGHEAILCDVDAETWTLTPQIARAIAARLNIGAVMPVAIYGVPLPADEWDAFQKETGIPVLIDAAAAFETQQIPAKALVVHSLHATKPFGVGEGGLLVCRDPDLITRSRVYSNFGTLDRVAAVPGSNTKMSEFHAAVGLEQIKRWGQIKSRRRQLMTAYQDHLTPIADTFAFQREIEKAVVSFLMLRLEEPLAQKIIAAGAEAEIALHKAYIPPLYRHPNFENLRTADTQGRVDERNIDADRKADRMSNSEMLTDHLIGIPFHPFLETADIMAVADFLSDQLATASRCHSPQRRAFR